MHRAFFQPTAEGEVRLLLLINEFSGGQGSLEGRTKLAKLDFLLRYPSFLRRALQIRAPNAPQLKALEDDDTVETRMVRYRFGPWDPAYFALLGSLIGRGLIVPMSTPRGLAYRTTSRGKSAAEQLSQTEAWEDVAYRTQLLKRHFDLAGSSLKDFVYKHFPEVTSARWGQQL